MFLFALAAQLSLPTVTNARVSDVREIFSYEDVPSFLLSQGNVDRTVYVRLTVRPDGTIQACGAEASSGDGKLDTYTCTLIVRRAKFRSAQWVDGSATYGVIRVPVRWTVYSDDSLKLHPTIPDLDLSVNHLPKGAHSYVDVYLEVAADEKGHPVSCGEWGPPKDAQTNDYPELVPIACQQATASLVLTPPIDSSGKPARSVQSVTVRFTLAQ